VQGVFSSYVQAETCDMIANGARVSCALVNGTCDLPWQAPTMIELVPHDITADAFGRPTQPTACHPMSTTVLLQRDSYGADGSLLQRGGPEAWSQQSCVSTAGLTLTVNGDAGRSSLEGLSPSTGVEPGSVPVIAWSADASAGDCVLESFVLGEVPRDAIHVRNDFASGTGSSGNIVGAAPMGSTYEGRDLRHVDLVLTCTNGDGAVAQRLLSVQSGLLPLP
jgi:hypothetical protein